MIWVYQALGISKQAYYKRQKVDSIRIQKEQKVIELVQNVRKEVVTKTGTRKLHKMLADSFVKHDLKLGRDQLFSILRYHQLLVKKTKRYFITTDSNHHFYKSPNRLQDTVIKHAEQAFVCDITYIKLQNKHAYLALVTDAYSRKIMGYDLQDNMKVDLTKSALKMAKKNCQFNQESIIHHSDRGLQYCCPDYSEFAEKMKFVLSTTQQYDPYENAIAERMNETLKYEFGMNRTIVDLATAQKMIKQAVQIYNSKRLHWSLDLKTPNEVHSTYNQIKNKSYKKIV